MDLSADWANLQWDPLELVRSSPGRCVHQRVKRELPYSVRPRCGDLS